MSPVPQPLTPTADSMLRLRRFLAAALGASSMAIAQPDYGGDTRRENPRGYDTGQPALVFFPPIPPPLGRPVSKLTTPPGGRQAPPSELGLFINEIFYPPLSTRLARGKLPPPLRQKLDDYRAAKTRLQAEFHAEFSRLRDAEPDARRVALEALARRQAAPLAQLELTAEALRAELNTSDTDWSAFRQWRLGNAGRGDRGDSPNEVAQVLRATAYYQTGLLPAQRRLLREISLEVAMSAEDAEKAAAAQPFLFFVPEPARVTLPDDLTSDLALLVAEFTSKKSTLKKELFDLAYAEDNATFAFSRNSKFKELASRQAPRLAELERLADRIRAGLRLLPDTTPAPPRSPLPPALTERTVALVQKRLLLQGETRDRLDEVGAQLRSVGARLGYQFDGETIKTQVVPGRRTDALPEEVRTRLADLRARVSTIENDYRTRAEAVLAELNLLRRETGEAIGRTAPEQIDARLNDAIRYVAERDNQEGYRDYRLAVFEPGLSPEQRRLVFDGAMEKLSLPLPRGEYQPTRRAATW